MTLPIIWTVMGFIGLGAALFGSYFAYFEYRETRLDLQAMERTHTANGSLALARDNVRKTGTQVLRLVGFSIVLLMFVAAGFVSIHIAPDPLTYEIEWRRYLVGICLLSAETIIVLIKIMDLINLRKQVQSRKAYARKFGGR